MSVQIEGDSNSTGDMRGLVHVETADVVFSFEAMQVGGVTYSTDLVTGQWGLDPVGLGEAYLAFGVIDDLMLQNVSADVVLLQDAWAFHLSGTEPN